MFSVLGPAAELTEFADAAILDLSNSFLATATSVDWWKFLYKLIYIPINLIFLMVTLVRLNQLRSL